MVRIAPFWTMRSALSSQMSLSGLTSTSGAAAQAAAMPANEYVLPAVTRWMALLVLEYVTSPVQLAALAGAAPPICIAPTSARVRNAPVIVFQRRSAMITPGDRADESNAVLLRRGTLTRTDISGNNALKVVMRWAKKS